VHLDETDGHVDNLCAFVKPGEVVLSWTDDRSDPQYEISRDAYERLMTARDARGRRFKVHKLVQPGPLFTTGDEAAGVDAAAGTKPREAGVRMAASYVNFYLGTKRVVVPLLDPKRDGAALRKLKALFPRREVVGVPGREILLGGGNIHCITQQVPAARSRRKGIGDRG
jgi:agmatine deiminase